MNIQDLLSKANSGDAASCYELTLYYTNNGDIANARVYLQKSLQLGYPRAFYDTGVILKDQKQPEGLKFLQRAAEMKYAPAMMTLGDMFREGDGVAVDKAQALRYYEQCATYGSAENKIGAAITLVETGMVNKDYYGNIDKWLKSAKDEMDRELRRNYSVPTFKKFAELTAFAGNVYKTMAGKCSGLFNSKQKDDYSDKAYEFFKIGDPTFAAMMALEDEVAGASKLEALICLRCAKLYFPEKFANAKEWIQAYFSHLEKKCSLRSFFISEALNTLIGSIDIAPGESIDDIMLNLACDFGSEFIEELSSSEIIAIAQKWDIYS